jgi:hypothetical protein
VDALTEAFRMEKDRDIRELASLIEEVVDVFREDLPQGDE